MTVFGLFGVLFGLLAIPVFARGESFQRLVVMVAIASVHLATTMAYYVYTKTNYADSYSYYHWDTYYRQMPWTTLGSAFAGHVTQFLKNGLGATYLDCFLIFQGFGVWGLLTALRLFKEIAAKTNSNETQISYCLLFLPSIQFWTTAIGKDVPVFFAVALFTWSMLNPRKRIFPAFWAVVIVVLFRVHVALAMGIALTCALLIEKNISGARKAFFVVLSCIGLLFLVSSVQDTFNVDVMSTSSVSHFMSARAVSEATENDGSSLRSSSLIVRLVSLLFRPFFFDGRNAFGMIASVENVGSVLLFGFLIFNFTNIRQLMKHVFFIRFCVFFLLILIAILTVLNYNVGLGIRERVMLYPPLFALFLAILGYRRRKEVTSPRPVLAATPLPQTRVGARWPTA